MIRTKNYTTSKYDKVANEIIDQVRRGELKPGDRMMSVKQMRDHYQISQATLHRVKKALRDKGVIDYRMGRYGGTFVADLAPYFI